MSIQEPERFKKVLLFYRDIERDTFFRNDRYLKRVIRPVYNLFKQGQKVSGFTMWYRRLVHALQQAGYEVHLNNYALAKKDPAYPVGLVGYPHLLQDWNLPNPAVLGPSLFDHPMDAPELMEDPRFRFYLVTCAWMRDLFQPYYGPGCGMWYAGIELASWPDTKNMPKPYDVLIYDKIRWNRDIYEKTLLNPILTQLHNRGLSTAYIRYQHYDHPRYQALLKQSKTMIFLCEHETQGMAYQEALASNLPVLAWDNGFWLDPNRNRYGTDCVPATSVPYFSPACGERFNHILEFDGAFERFWENRLEYQPRQFVQDELSLAGSAQVYMQYYSSAGGA